ncbi:hypothetical protein DWB85_09850 [Seongchinamella sediminis]|uniref:UspA domain-containing protein n=1 Tax=Seongchinamella sediminis TaxID=2283635 RepID=A0A3L7E169_9GAMM|nr:universal stress protein [Seongchinamella sediminis]RLQ21882.1 hypothetical protein DWB85_09850 [Seongchinamella sediminis]
MVLNKIFVIIDPTLTNQPAFERAFQSAQMTGTRLHLYACITGTEAGASVDAGLTVMGERMEVLLMRCQDAGIEAVQEVEQGDDWSQAALRAAARCSASMIFKNSFEHSEVQRGLRPTSDYTLLRLSPCPVLLVKNNRDWSHRRVLAAVNSESTNTAHIKLNHLIISFAQNVTEAYGSDCHFVTVCKDVNQPPDIDTVYGEVNHPPDIEEFATTCGAPPEHVHALTGSAAPAISKLAERIEVDLIIIGTVGRDGIKARLIGNTAEKVLDQTAADVLVIN